MESGPPEIIEIAIGWLIPVACREEVLGDLRERYRSLPQHLFEAACTVPCVIWSRIRRTTDAVLLLVEWLLVYGMQVFAAVCLNRNALFDNLAYLHLAIPPTIILAVTILFDAYADPRTRRFDPVLGPAAGLGLAAAFGSFLPTFVFTLGAVSGALLVAALRVTFPPEADRPLVAKIPAFWQRLELVPGRSLIVISIQAALFLMTLLFVLLGRRFFGF